MALMRRNRRVRSLALLLTLVVVGAYRAAAPNAEAAPARASPEAVYAAFTLNLMRFISWPDDAIGAPPQPFIIGTFPQDPINGELDAAAQGEVVNGHPVRTIRLHSLDDVARCQAVFISHDVARPAAVVARAVRKPILTISDADGFLAMGGHVRFVPQPPHTRLQISAENLRASGLAARAQLLRLAATP
jgi:hypothetical protein